MPLYFCEFIAVARRDVGLTVMKRSSTPRRKWVYGSVRILHNKQPKLIGTQMAYWFGFAAVSGAFGGLIAFGISTSNVALAHWRLLLVVEVCCSLFPQALILR